MPSTLSYEQRLLSGRTFRLLHIVPAIDPHQQLKCYCLPYNLDDAPPYEALSYVWGNPDPSVNILCNGQSVAIGPELSYALRRLRLREASRIIWADAICINQQDDAEKSHQVPLMGSVYSLAKRVVVWLGQGDAQQIRRAFDCCETIASACHQFDQERGLQPDDRHEEVDLPREHFSSSVLSSLQESYNRTWFNRIWCIQEIRLARDAIVVWGDDEISWTNFALSASWIFDKSAELDVNPSDPVASLLTDIRVEHADIMRDQNMYPIIEALGHFREFQASNPRDKVYGLLNLVSSRSEVEALNVDYSKSVGEVYADTVLVVIRSYSRLTALAHVTHPANYDGPGPGDYKQTYSRPAVLAHVTDPVEYNGPSPEELEDPKDYKARSHFRSWAPRWDDLAVADKLGHDDPDCPWHPFGKNAATMIVAKPDEPTQLCLKGVVYDSVYEVGDIMDYYNMKDPEYAGDPKFANDSEDADVIVPDDADDTDFYDPTETHPCIKALPCIDLDMFPERFARTLTAGRSGKSGAYLDRFSTQAQARHTAACFHFISRLLHIQTYGDEGEWPHSPDSLQYQSDAYHTCEQRRIFWTEKRSYGVGPHCMRSGDVVVVLYGGNTPYVLRPRGNEYIFMGQAYVDEIMHGELFDELEVSPPQEQTFCLI